MGSQKWRKFWIWNKETFFRNVVFFVVFQNRNLECLIMYIVAHAKERAKERYNKSVNRDVYYSLIHKIQIGKSTCIKRMSNSRTVHLVDDFVVVYSSTRKKIVTFLPSDCKEIREWKQCYNV